MDILIASEQSNLRFSLEVFLRQQPGIVVMAAVNSTESLSAIIHTARPDLVMMDWDLPGRSPVEVLTEIKAIEHAPHFIILGKDVDTAQIALGAGADEFLIWGDDAPTSLLAAIHRVGSGKQPSDQDAET
jgi:DNA-binding NarL/FixJ family response regulator